MTAPPREATAQLKGQSQKRLHYHHQQLGSAGALTIPGFKHLVGRAFSVEVCWLWNSLSQTHTWFNKAKVFLSSGYSVRRFTFPGSSICWWFRWHPGLHYKNCPGGISQSCQRMSCSAESVLNQLSRTSRALEGVQCQNISYSSMGICHFCTLSNFT